MSVDGKYTISRETIVTIESEKFVATMSRAGQLFLATKLPLFRVSHVNMQDKRSISTQDARELADFLAKAAELNETEFLCEQEYNEN